MAGSVLGYRVFRLRRLILVCLGLIALGLWLGLWLIPGPVTALQLVLGCGIFSILAMAHLAMILIWPTDPGGPLTYATGSLILLAVALPAGAHQLATGTEVATLLVITVMLGPFIWLFGASLLGQVPLILLNKVLPTAGKRVRVFDLPVDLPRAMALFAMDPDKTRLGSVHGPVGWDGCFDETVTRMVADAATGVLRAEIQISKIRILAQDDRTRSVMVTAAQPEGGVALSMVIHQEFAATAHRTRLTERLDFEDAPGFSVWTGWLTDAAEDYVTAALDADAGRQPRAISLEPLDSMGTTITRFFRWGEPTPGG